MKILIVEDNAILAADLVDRLSYFGYSEILGPFSDGKKALNSAIEEHPNLAILDVTLKGDFSGLHLAKEMIDKGLKTKIVFLTQHQDDDVLSETLSIEPLAFINKPYTNSELKAIIHKAKSSFGDEHKLPEIKNQLAIIDDRIFVRNGRGKSMVFLKDILWIESGGGSVSSVITKKILLSEKKQSLTIGTNLKELEKRLGASKFIRVSRFHMVNLIHIQRIIDNPDGRKLIVIEGKEISVGEKYRKKLSERLIIW